MNASASRGRSSARIFGRRGRRAVRFAVSLACLASAPAGSLPASGDTVFEPFAVPILAASLSPARSPVVTAFLLALAAAAALLFALWRRAEAARSRERLAKDMRFRSLLEETNEGVVSEAGGQIVYSNPAFRRLFQRHEGELLGKPLHLLFAPESRERLMEVRTALLDADPVPESYEAVAMTPGGARFDVEIRAAMVSFEGREAMQMTFRDITRRKRAEVRLRRSEERYRSLFERSLAGVYRSDLAGKLLDCNDAFARILGFTSREEALGVPLTRHDFDPGDRARLTARLLAEKALTNIEVRLRRKDGEPVWVLKNEALARADDGSHSLLEGTIVDISDRQRAEQAIRESEERFRRLSEATFEGIAITEEGRILETNRQFASLFGYEPEEMTYLSALELVAADSRALVSSDLQAGDEKPYEVLGRRKDGTTFPAEAWGRVLPYKGRTVRVTALRDITERKRAGEELHRSEEKYRDLVEGSEALICLHDLEGRLLAINPAAARNLGGEPASLVGRNIREFLPEKTWAAFDQYLVKIRTEGAAEGYMAILTGQGEKRMWHYHNSLRAEGAAGPVVRGMAIDVTDQRRAERALRDSETLYRMVTETVTDAILTMDAESTILFVNAAAERVFGYTRAELIGQRLTMLMPERLRHSHEVGISRYNRTGEKRLHWGSLQLPGRHKDGHEIPLELSFGEVVRDGKRLFTGILRDISERATAEETLRRSEERYRLLFERNLAGVYSATTEGRLIECNDAFAQMMGYATPAEAVAGSADSSQQFREEREEFLARLQAEGSLVNFESRARRRDGSPIWILENATIIPAEGERPEVLQGTALDITERKRAEQEARLLLETALAIGDAADFDSALSVTLRRICEATGWVLGQAWIPRADGSVLECSPARYIAAGARLERFRDLSETFVFPPGVGLPGRAWSSRRPAWIQDVGDDTNFPRAPGAREAGLRAGMGIPVLVGDAVVAVLEFFVLEQRAEDTHLVRLISAVAGQLGSTIHRKRAEQALRESEEKYRDIFEFAPIGIYQARPDGSLLTANAMLAAMLGHTAVDELRERNLKDLYFDPAERDVLFSEFERHEAARSLALSWKRKDGRAIWVELDAHALKDEEGRVRYYEGFVHDITQRKRAEDEKRNLQEQLAQSQKIEAVGQLAGGIAHDFNNLLTAIGGYSELLLAELPPGDPRRSHAEEVRRAGDRAASLTRQLLAYSRRQVLEPRVLDLNAIVLDLEKILRRLIGEQIQLRTRPFDGLWPVKADPGQIEQAILNLAINARDAMPDGGTLTIETANVEHSAEDFLSHAPVLPGPYAMVAVSDTGIGMNEEVKAHIFEPFFTTKEQGKGTGLGLSTTYGIVKQSGGHILCESEPGRGATFRLYLPRVQEVIEKASPPPAIPSPRTGEETILLVEDEPEVRSLVERVLKMQGYTVLVAANADEALAVSQRFRGEIAIMVSDVVMPGISGKQLADCLAASRPETKVLFMSGYTVDAIVHHGILDPGVAFLQKPFTPQALGRKVREVLDAAPEEFKVS